MKNILSLVTFFFISYFTLSQVKVSCVVKEDRIDIFPKKVSYHEKIIRRYDYNMFGGITKIYNCMDSVPIQTISYDSLGRIDKVFTKYYTILYNYREQQIPTQNYIVTTDKYFDNRGNKSFIDESHKHFFDVYIFDAKNILLKSTHSLLRFNKEILTFDSIYYTSSHLYLPLKHKPPLGIEDKELLLDSTYKFDDNGFLINHSPNAAPRHPVFSSSSYIYNDIGLIAKEISTIKRKEYGIWIIDSTTKIVYYNQFNDISKIEYYIISLEGEQVRNSKLIIETYSYKYEMTLQRKHMLLYPKGFPIEYQDIDILNLFQYHIILPSIN